MVHQSEEDEGHLPHPQPLQHRRDAEVSDRRGVVSRLRSGLHPVRSASGDGESPCLSADASSGRFVGFSSRFYEEYCTAAPSVAACVTNAVEAFRNQQGSSSVGSHNLKVVQYRFSVSRQLRVL